jgi:glutamate synthase (NADPH/NADH) small chain
LRIGAKSVTVYYHRTQEEMPALRTEYEEAEAEGVSFVWKSSVQEFLSNGERLTSARVKIGENETIVPLDKMLLAVGSRPANRIVSTTEGIEVDEMGYVKTRDLPYGMTTRRGIFAGGDVVHTPQTVVLAMREAKAVAKGIAQYVDAKKLLGE